MYRRTAARRYCACDEVRLMERKLRGPRAPFFYDIISILLAWHQWALSSAKRIVPFVYMKKIQLGGHRSDTKIRGYALVDDEDYEELNTHHWCMWTAKKGRIKYAARTIGRNPTHIIYMHREILKAPKHLMCDHINGNGLDNRRSNLRLCTNQQNQWNIEKWSSTKSGHRGVFFSPTYKKWQVQMRLNNKSVYVGMFNSLDDAIVAANSFKKKHHGDFARLSVIKSSEKGAKEDE